MTKEQLLIAIVLSTLLILLLLGFLLFMLLWQRAADTQLIKGAAQHYGTAGNL
jgi:hypothetical protein